MDEEHILYGPEPTLPVFEGTAGQYVFEALSRYQRLTEAMISAETKQVISYRTLLEKSCQLAQALLHNGFSHSTIAAIYSENCLEYLYPIFASWYLGIAVAPLNYEYIKSELSYIVNLSKPEIIFCSMATLENVKKLKQELPYIKQIIVINSNRAVKGAVCLDLFISNNGDDRPATNKFKPLEFNCDKQIGLILCSSGTTGLPKGVMITHRNLAYLFATFMEPQLVFDMKPGSTLLNFLPLFHGYGIYSTFQALFMGYRVILMKSFNPILFLNSIQDYKVNYLRIVPTVVLFLTKSPIVVQYDFSSVRQIFYGGAAISKELEEALKNGLGGNVEILQAYGLTEATFGVSMGIKGKHKFGSSGKILPYVTAKVCDIQNGKTLKANQLGEILVKGSLITKGYIGDVKATSESFLKEGWLRTGDIGYYDDEDCLFIVDRLKELIKYKGFQVSPVELEALLLQHPKISDSAVVGIPDEKAGQLPLAFIVKKEAQNLTEDEVLQFVASEVSPQKHLRGGVYFVDEIPRTPSGKILRRKLVQLLEQKFSKL